MLAQRHRPLAVGQALSTILQAVDADSIVKTRIDRLISTYTYEFGGCNRIYNTAIPSAYTRYVAFALRSLAAYLCARQSSFDPLHLQHSCPAGFTVLIPLASVAQLHHKNFLQKLPQLC